MTKLEELKKKLAAMETGGKGKRVKWKPTDEHVVRCLPIPGDEELGLVLKWHYGVDGGRPMICPTTVGDDCPFCKFAQGLKGWKNADGRDKTEAERKQDWEFFKTIDAATKYYVPIVLRKKDDANSVEGPFLWELTSKTYQSLMKICTNDDWNEDHPEGGVLKILTSLEHALDVVVTLKKKGEKGNTTSFDLTDVEERKKFSAIFKNDKKAAQALLEKVPNLDDVGKPATTSEAEIVFKAWKSKLIEGTSSDKTDASSGVEYGASTNSAEKPKTGGDDVDDVIAKLNKRLEDSKQKQA